MAKKSKYNCNPQLWVEHYSDELFRFASVRVKSREIAEDLVQDTFLSGLNAVKNFRGDCHEKSWLYNILRNKIIDHYRKKTNQEIKQGALTEDGEGEDSFYHRFFMREGTWAGHWKKEARPGNWGDSADHKMEKEEFMNFLLLCMSLLPETWSKVFSLKNVEEFTTKEVCKELDITPSNLWTIIHRAKLQLRGCLEKRWKGK
ncbi:MAG TPA: sigma-70 family RNA polymerase sigma factor [Prolixibacteraceae bacterium]|nr:sigma-70 family RNA polymerase sigma factor [Prolixibacteraceae bacterium]